MLVFQDMKKFNYYYWFAYPCLSEPVIDQVGSAKAISEDFTSQQLEALTQQYFSRKSSEEQQFFIVEKNETVSMHTLAEKITAAEKETNFANTAVDSLYFCYADPCATPAVAGWTARLYFSMIIHLW